ncbi:UDP-glycosyltransferase 85A3 [Linum perenne]
MSSQVDGVKAHAVCVPFPAQSHIKATLKFAKLLHNRGFHITFVNTEFNHNRFLRAKGPHALDGIPDFRPPVSCVVADGMMVFALQVAREVGIPSLSYWTFAACGFMGFKQYRPLYDQGLTPFKEALNEMYPNRVYTVGPMQLLLNQIKHTELDSIGYSLWEEEPQCLRWLNSKPMNSVLYVNFGSVIGVSFLWVIRPDLVIGESAALPPEFEDKVEKTGFISGWCPQEEVLNHSAVGGFLTHCGWGSTIETLTAGVPVLCWPFFADQQTNCKFACKDWKIGMEIDKDVKREDVEELVRELMKGNKGYEMREKAQDWARLARESTGSHGSSTIAFDRLINQVLLKK